MSECCITFPGFVSRPTICRLVIEYMKYVLYYRGQFPLPLDQLIQSLKYNEKSSSEDCNSARINDHQVYYDNRSNQLPIAPRSNIASQRAKQLFLEAVMKFDGFFNHLFMILESENVLEVVLNIGPNMMSPKELYHITLPARCDNNDSTQDYASLQQCKMKFFRSILQSTLWKDLKCDSILPVSVLLLLGPGVPLTENMELKSFYSLPRNCKPRTVRFAFKCDHANGTISQLENVQTDSFLQEAASAPKDLHQTVHWVKMKPDLKGFKLFFEEKRSLSSSGRSLSSGVLGKGY